MHDFEEPTTLDIDRLVDGATTDDEERNLLARLDDVPGGWRRLALAFCEDRALRRAFGPEPEPEPTADVVRPVDPRSSILEPPARRRGTSWFAPAVVGLLSLAVGLLIGFGWPRNGDAGIADSGVPSVATDGDALVEDTRTLELLVDDGLGVRRVEVPILPASEVDVEWMDVERPVVPERVRAAFEAAGHEVAEGRRFIRVPLDDERDALVPVGHFSVERVEYQ